MMMIELKTAYTLTRIPYITRDALEDYAIRLVEDFDPERIRFPGVLDIDRFITEYLELEIEVQRIWSEKTVRAVTVFKEGSVAVYDPATRRKSHILCSSGTVVVDSSLMYKQAARRLRFTLAHEGAHWCMHRHTFAADNPFEQDCIAGNHFLAAKSGRADYNPGERTKTDLARMEQQADFLAASILMPLPAVNAATYCFFHELGETPRTIIPKASNLDDHLASQLPQFLADTFEVSAESASIRLKKLSYIASGPKPSLTAL